MKANCNYSVALCTYNGERYIAEQLNSILSQTIPPKEIIISDDVDIMTPGLNRILGNPYSIKVERTIPNV